MVNLEEEEAARKAAEKETAAQSKRVKRAVKQTAGSWESLILSSIVQSCSMMIPTCGRFFCNG